MFARALIVLLLVLNLGVAAWWALRPAPQPRAVGQDTGIARLQLVSELPARAVPRQRLPSAAATPALAAHALPVEGADPALTTDTVTTPDPGNGPQTCFSFGPFDAEAVATARARLQPLVQRIVVRTRTQGPVTSWRVYLPPLANAEAATAMAKRIADAGFSDYLIMHEGTDANAIALGSYGSETTAQRRVQELSAAGFPARARPVGGSQSVWLDVSAAPGFDPVAAQSHAAAPGREPLDCATLP